MFKMQYYEEFGFVIHDVSGSIKCVCVLGSISNVLCALLSCSFAILYFNSLCATVNLKVHISQINPPDTLPISLTKGARSSGVFREQDKADVHEAKKI